MALGNKAVYLVYAGFASILVVVMNLYYPATWNSISSQLFGNITATPYLQNYILDIMILGIAYFAAYLSISGIRKEGASQERDRWADRMSS